MILLHLVLLCHLACNFAYTSIYTKTNFLLRLCHILKRDFSLYSIESNAFSLFCAALYNDRKLRIHHFFEASQIIIEFRLKKKSLLSTTAKLIITT